MEEREETFINAGRSPIMKMGIGGNLYVYCGNIFRIEEICDQIGKSRNSIYFNNRFGCFVIRCKSKKHKSALHEIFTEGG